MMNPELDDVHYGDWNDTKLLRDPLHSGAFGVFDECSNTEAEPGLDIGLPVLSLTTSDAALEPALTFLDPRLLGTRLSRSRAAVTLGLSHPNARAIRRPPPICPRSPSASRLRANTHRGVPSPTASHVRGTQV